MVTRQTASLILAPLSARSQPLARKSLAMVSRVAVIEVAVDLVPVVMGTGRPFFGELSLKDVPLGDPTVCIQGDRVTHLVFPAGTWDS
jgi:hypothetical protein